MRSEQELGSGLTRRAWMAAGLLAIVTLGACRAPVGVTKLSPAMAHREVTRSALSGTDLSIETEIVLRRYDLLYTARKDPEQALGDLHAIATSDRAHQDQLFALADLSLLHAEQAGSRSHYLAAAIYAYAFLFPENDAPSLHPVDPRTRMAADIYNRAVARSFASPDDGTVVPEGGEFPLPFGTLAVEFDPASLELGKVRLVSLRASADYEIRGLRNRYRRPGVGAPLAAATEPLDPEQPLADFVPPQVRVPVTLLLAIDEPRTQLADSRLRARLEIQGTWDEEEVELAGEPLPLEAEPSVALAATLVQTRYWQRELSTFLGKLVGAEEDETLFGIEPHRPGRIPLVFVHGTNSSPARWANMVNDLENTPEIDRRYEFWFFRYNSGSPIPYSAMLLRRALSDTVAALDPDGQDPCIQQMIVTGHSQGGLLTKMTAIDPGTKLWDAMSDRPLDEVSLSDESRALIREAVFIEPLPFVTRTVFISTPHRGSFLASSGLARRLASRLITMPASVLRIGADLSRGDTAGLHFTGRTTAIDNMSPGHPFIRALSSVPIAERITAHSIIPVKDDTPLETADDGVVKYQSAHIDDAASELIVRSGHSVQSHPHAVEEMRRILRLHAEQVQCSPDRPAGRA